MIMSWMNHGQNSIWCKTNETCDNIIAKALIFTGTIDDDTNDIIVRWLSLASKDMILMI